jgi:hypothetical protein
LSDWKALSKAEAERERSEGEKMQFENNCDKMVRKAELASVVETSCVLLSLS